MQVGMAVKGQVSPALLDAVHTYGGSRATASQHHFRIAPEVTVLDDGWQSILVDDVIDFGLSWWH